MSSEDIKAVIERRKTQNFMFAALPVEKLYGNLYMDYEGMLMNFGLKEASSFNEFLDSLKSYRLNSKNYAGMFQTKAKVMIAILHSLFDNIDKKKAKVYEFYEEQVSLNLCSTI